MRFEAAPNTPDLNQPYQKSTADKFRTRAARVLVALAGAIPRLASAQPEIAQHAPAPSFEQMLTDAEKIVGPDAQRVNNAASFHEQLQKPTEVSEFTFQTPEFAPIKLSPEIMKQIIHETYPKGWFDGSVRSLKEMDVHMAVDSETSRADRDTLYGGYTPDDRNIALYDITMKLDQVKAFQKISHESGHAHEWQTDTKLSKEERAALLLSVLDRIDPHSEDTAFFSPYAMNIRNKNKQHQRFLQAQEYYAEICAAYFNDPSSLDKSDFAIVDQVVKKHDPTFNPYAALEKRNDIINHAIFEQTKDVVRARLSLDHLPTIRKPIQE